MRQHFVWAITLLLVLTGCGRGGGGAPRAGEVVDLTTEALLSVLLGVPPERAATLAAPPDPGLLKTGVYETVLVAVDADAFARVSRGALTVSDLRAVQKSVSAQVDKELKRRGFAVQTEPSPADKTLLATLTPVTQEIGSPDERARGKNKTLVLVRLTVVDAKTGAILARRDYYSGRDVKAL